MEFLEAQKNVCRVKPCCVFFKSTNLSQIEEEFASWAVLKYKTEITMALKGEVHIDYKRVLNFFQNAPFSHGILNLMSLNDFGFFQNLKRIKLFGVLLFNQCDGAISPLPQDSDQLEVLLT